MQKTKNKTSLVDSSAISCHTGNYDTVILWSLEYVDTVETGTWSHWILEQGHTVDTI